MSYPNEFGFRSVGNCVAIDPEMFRKIGVEPERALAVLSLNSFCLMPTSSPLSYIAFCHQSRYRRGALWQEAPNVVDCSSLIKWLYGEIGIWLPRRTIQQRMCGVEVSRNQIRYGDLVFVSGVKNYYTDDPVDGVGHVGIRGIGNLVVHATNRPGRLGMMPQVRSGVIETPLDEFIGDGFRGARRIVPDLQTLWVFEDLKKRGIEVSDDLVWIVAQQL